MPNASISTTRAAIRAAFESKLAFHASDFPPSYLLVSTANCIYALYHIIYWLAMIIGTLGTITRVQTISWTPSLNVTQRKLSSANEYHQNEWRLQVTYSCRRSQVPWLWEFFQRWSIRSIANAPAIWIEQYALTEVLNIK